MIKELENIDFERLMLCVRDLRNSGVRRLRMICVEKMTLADVAKKERVSKNSVTTSIEKVFVDAAITVFTNQPIKRSLPDHQPMSLPDESKWEEFFESLSARCKRPMSGSHKWTAIDSFAKLLSYSANDFLEWKGFGVGTMAELRAKLAGFGLRLRGE